MSTIKRTIHYYEINLKFSNGVTPQDGDKINFLFRELLRIVREKESNRYQTYGERVVSIQSIKFKKTNKQIFGKLLCIRKDLFPEIMNLETDTSKGIETAENEGLLETTHFILDYSKSKPILSIEYNQFGSKIGDLISYINNLGTNSSIIDTLDYVPVVADELKSFKKRIGECSALLVKVNKNNIDKIKNIDGQLFTAMEASIKQFENEYAEIKFKFDYKNDNQNKITKTINNVIDRLIRSKKNIEAFDTLQITAEDSENGNYLKIFDLLIDKIKSEINVERKARYKTIISDDIFTKMTTELLKILKFYP